MKSSLSPLARYSYVKMVSREKGAIFMRESGRRREDLPLAAPNAGGNVWPKQTCPAFAPRGGAAEHTCWYCVYADFHLDKPRALDVGVCEWPNKKTK